MKKGEKLTADRLGQKAHLLSALQKGPVRNAGGVLIDCNNEALGITFTELYSAIRELQECGCAIQRIDAGGLPEWVLIKSNEEVVCE